MGTWQNYIDNKYGQKKEAATGAASSAKSAAQSAVEKLYNQQQAAKSTATGGSFAQSAVEKLYSQQQTAQAQQVAQREAEAAQARADALNEMRARLAGLGQIGSTVGQTVGSAVNAFKDSSVLNTLAEKMAQAKSAAATGLGSALKSTAEKKAGALERFMAANPEGLSENRRPELQSAYLDAYNARMNYDGMKIANPLDEFERGDAIKERLGLIGDFSHPEEWDQYIEEKGINWALGEDRQQDKVKELIGKRGDVANLTGESQRWADMGKLAATSEEALAAMEQAGGEYAQAAQMYRRSLEKAEERAEQPAGSETGMPTLSLVDGKLVMNSAPQAEGAQAGRSAQGPLIEDTQIEDALNAAWKKLIKEQTAGTKQALNDAQLDQEELERQLAMAWNEDYEHQIGSYQNLQRAENDAYEALRAARAEDYRTELAAAQDETDSASTYMRLYYATLPGKSDFEANSEGPYRKLTDNEIYNAFDDGAGDYEASQRRNAMTDGELKTANYLYNTEGADAARAYVDSLERTLNKRVMDATEQRAYEWGQKSPIAASIASVAGNMTNNIVGGGYVIGQIGKALTGREKLSFDENHPALAAGVARDAMREGVTSSFGDSWLGRFGKFVYDTGMSAGLDSGTNMLVFGPVGEFTMGLGVMASTMREVKLKGGTDEQAALLSGVAGTAEVITEHLGYDRIRNLFGAERAQIIKDIGASMISEFGEEATSELVNIMADVFVMGDRSDFEEKAQAYRERGFSEEDAVRWAIKDMAEQVGMAGLGGALGGLMTGGGSAALGQAFNAVAEANAKHDINRMSETYGKAASVFQNNWDGEMMPGLYKAAFDALYDAGADGRSFESVQASASGILDGMDEVKARTIYTAGQNAAAEEARVLAGREEALKNAFGDSARSDNAAMNDKNVNARANNVATSDNNVTTSANNGAENGAEDTSSAPAEHLPLEGKAFGQNQQTVTPGVVRQYTAQKLTHEQRQRLRFLDAFGKRMGVEIDMVDSLAGGRMNGQYAPGGPRVTVALDATEGAYVQVAAHEMVHYIRSQSEDSYKVLQELVSGYLRESESFDLDAAIEKRMAEYAGTQALDRNTALEEIIAEAVPTMLTDEAVVREIVQRDMTLGQRILDRFKNAAQILREIIEKITMRNYEDAANYTMKQGRGEIAALLDEAEKLQKIYTVFEDAMNTANEAHEARQAEQNHRAAEALAENMEQQAASVKGQEVAITTEGGATIKYSLSRYEDQLAALRNGTFPERDFLYVMETPEILNKAGVTALPILMTQEHARSVMKVSGYKEANYHGLTITGMKKLPSAIANPIMVIKAHNYENRVIVITEMEDEKGNNVIAPIELNGRGRIGGRYIEANILTTAYGKNNLQKLLLTAAMNDEVIYADKKRSNQLAVKAGVQFPGIIRAGGFIHTIADFAQKVKENEEGTENKGLATPTDEKSPVSTSETPRGTALSESISDQSAEVNPSTKFSLNTNSEAFKRWFGDSQIVNEDGTPKVMYHGTASDFWAFDMRKSNDKTGRMMGLGAGKDKIYLTEYEASARAAASGAASRQRGGSERVIPLFVSAQKVMDRAEYNVLLDKAYEKYTGARPFEAGYDYKQRDKAVADVDRQIRREGFDGVWDRDSGEMFVYSPTQVKSATDNIGTYDRKNPDIRFSLKNTGDTAVDTAQVLGGINGRPAIRIAWAEEALQNTTVDEKTAASQILQETDMQAEAAEKLVRTAVGRTAKAQMQRARNYADRVLKQYSSDYNKATMRDNMVELMEELAANGPSQNTLNEAAKLGRAVIEKSKDTTLRDDYKELRKTLRETPITLTETQRQEAKNIAGSYGAFRNSVFGTFNLAKEGKSLDAIWQEWSDKAPDLFPPDTYEGDMVQKLRDVKAAFMPRFENPYGETFEAACTDLGLQIHEELLGTLGDSQKRDDVRRAINELRAQFRAEFDEEILRTKAARREAFDNIASSLRQAKATGNREAAQQAMKAYREQLRRISAEQAEAMARLTYRQEYEDRTARAKAYERIRKYAENMRRMLAKPDKNRHVPAAIQGELVTVLNAIDFSRNGRESEGTRAWKQSLNAISDFLARQLDIQTSSEERSEAGHEGVWMSLCRPQLDMLNENMEVIKKAGKSLSSMTLEELSAVSNAMSVIQHSINSINTLWTNKRHETIDAVCDETMRDLGKIRDNRAQNSGIAAVREIDKLLNIDNLDAGSFFERLGGQKGAAYSIYEELQEGQSAAYARVREASEAAPEILGFTEENEKARTRTIRGWAKEKHTFELPVIRGGEAKLETVTMTGTQLMELYALSKRQQAKMHLLTGGIRIAGEDGKTGDSRIWKMEEGQLSSMLSELTDDQKKTVDRMQGYLSGTVSEWGNDVTEKMYLYRMFGEENYWPIRSERGFMRTKEQNGSVLFNALTNAGFTKQTQEVVRNPIVIGDAIETFSGHISDMATFSGLAMPVDDLLRWYNYADRDADGRVSFTDSVKKQIERTLGRAGNQYIQNLMDDLNGMGKKAPTTGLIGWAMGNYKRAAIMAKLRVVIQQPTAILRASAMINPKYFSGLTRGIGKNTVDEMQAHSALAWWKGNGNYEIGTGASMKSIITGMQDSTVDDVFETLNSPAGWADDKGWAAIWQAVKRETAAEHSDLEAGSDAYWEHVAARFDAICMQTQVVDTILTRSAMMRSKDSLMKTATAFMSEPTKNFNLMRTGLSELKAAIQSGDAAAQRAAAAKIMRSGAAITAATALNAAMTALFDALKYYSPDDDKDEWGESEGFWHAVGMNWVNDMLDGMNPLANIPFVKDVWEIATGGDVERMDMSAASRLYSAVTRAWKYAQGNPNSYTTWAALKPLITSAGDLMGLPVSGLVADVEFVINGARNVMGKGAMPQKLPTATKAGAYAELYSAIVSGDAKKANQLRTALKKQGQSEETISRNVADKLALEDDRVRQAWEARQAGKARETANLKKAIMADGFTDGEATRAINRYAAVIESDAKAMYIKAVEQGKEDKAAEYEKKLKSVGVTDEDMAAWFEEKDMDAALEEKGFYENKNLYAAIRSRETTDADMLDIRDYLAEHSKAKDPMSTISSNLSSEFKQEYIDLVNAGNEQEAARLKGRLMTLGVKEKTIDDWAPRAAKSDLTTRLKEAIDKGDARAAEAEVERMLDEEIMKADDMKQRLNNYYKPIYIELMTSGKEDEAEKLAEMLGGLGLRNSKGENYFRGEIFNGWLLAWEKEQEKDKNTH